MRVVFFVRVIMPEGGVTLATYRLATALVESGVEAEVLYCAGEPPEVLRHLGRRIPSSTSDGTTPKELTRSLEQADPTVVVVGSGEVEDLSVGMEVAPTLMHAHLHMGMCPDMSRYWYRLKRPCVVKAGWKCAALRPVLGCNDLKHSLHPGRAVAQQRLLKMLSTGPVGVLCVSTAQAELYVRHGVPQSRVASLPNLGIRSTPSDLAEASRSVPKEWRSSTAFIGRLSKAKGGELLSDLARDLSSDARLRVFGEGYLSERLSSLPNGILCGHVSQEMVAGVLMWARAVVFPSLWPEPGGIVGVDAQVMGVPLAAFDIGAGRHWPGARKFGRTETRKMTEWLNEQEPCTHARDPDAVALAQAEYWGGVASQAEKELSSFADRGAFEQPADLPVERLMQGPKPSLETQ